MPSFVDTTNQKDFVIYKSTYGSTSTCENFDGTDII